jgi:hypothetical protein
MMAQIAFGLRVRIPARSTASLGEETKMSARWRAVCCDEVERRCLSRDAPGTSAKLKPTVSAGMLNKCESLSRSWIENNNDMRQETQRYGA